MRKLYIIGNGFDVAHGIKSRYSDFKDYCSTNMCEMFDKLCHYYNDEGKKLWSDLERELPNLNQDALFGWATINNKEWNQNSKGYKKFVDEIRNEIDYIEGLKLYFTEWVESISLAKVSRKYNLPSEGCWYLTFNYTHTLENIYHIPVERILHIHGKAKRLFSQLVVGHNMSDEQVDEKFSSDNEIEVEVSKEVADLVKGWRKDTDGIIAANEVFFNSLSYVTDVYVLGHSMNDIDLPYYVKVKQSVSSNATWHISVYHDEKEKRLAAAKLNLTNVEYINLEDLSIYREGALFG